MTPTRRDRRPGAAIKGRVKDTTQVISDDGDLLAEGSTEHAEAMHSIHDEEHADDLS